MNWRAAIIFAALFDWIGSKVKEIGSQRIPPSLFRKPLCKLRKVGRQNKGIGVCHPQYLPPHRGKPQHAGVWRNRQQIAFSDSKQSIDADPSKPGVCDTFGFGDRIKIIQRTGVLRSTPQPMLQSVGHIGQLRKIGNRIPSELRKEQNLRRSGRRCKTIQNRLFQISCHLPFVRS